MGHLIGKDIYRKLGKKIDNLSTRAPWSDALYAVLRELFSTEEADVFIKMPYGLSTLDRIAKIIKYEGAKLKKILDNLSSKGLIMDLHLNGDYQYMPSPLFIGIFEFTMMRTGDRLNTKEWAEFFHAYALQTIKDNVSLLTPQILDEINQIIVQAGHDLMLKNKDDKLKGSCDSFVVETDVHYPTDTNLLFDAMRKMISLIAIICSEIGITEWRQSHHNILKVKRLLRGIQKLKRSTSKDGAKKIQRDKFIVREHQNYIDVCQSFVLKAKETIRILRELRILSLSQDLRLNAVEEYIRHAERQIDQIRRRVIFDEKIPHEEKVFSIFEPHTEWISKGKAGVPQELGLSVCVLKDQYGFILYHQVLEQQTDDKVSVEMAKGAKDRFHNLAGCSFDKGFYSPDNKGQLGNILDYVILPKKGRLSAKDKEIERSEEFVLSRRKHSAVESSINALENHGLDRCLDHGLHGFKRYVALSVLARNMQILGHLIQQKELRRQKRRKAA